MNNNSSLEKEKDKLIHEKCQQILSNLLKDEDNKYCVDCDGKSPRWASWNIGIFLCIRCAGIHRNLGVHISKVKSVNLDAWKPHQVACIEQMGNSRARAVYEANLPDTFRRPQNDSLLEKFVRAKYEAKKYIAKEWVQPSMPKPTWDIIIEKQLLQKKEKKSSIGTNNFSIPKSPSSKPKAISPKTLSRASSSKISPNPLQKAGKSTEKPSENGEVPVSQLQDLLGLDISTMSDASNDPFGDFLSAPMTTTLDARQLKTNSDQLAEETSFFNQKQPDLSVSEKLSKDSILALYSKVPINSQKPTFGGTQGLNNPLSQCNQNSTNVQHGFSGYHQNSLVLPQATVGNLTSSGIDYNQAVSALQTGPQMVPIVPAGFQLSAANPFAQMQSQMTGMNLTGVNPRQLQMMRPNMNPQFTMVSPVSNYLQKQNNSLETNLWQ